MLALLAPDYATVTNSYTYDPYGVTEHQTGSQYNPWQFASGYFDASTLYYKFGTRYYDRFGRWTQKDSQPSANPYMYANDDPVNEVDPSGKFDVIPEYGLTVPFLGIPILTGVTIAFTSEDIASLEGSGGDLLT